MPSLCRQLKKIYLMFLSPAVAGFVLAAVNRRLDYLNVDAALAESWVAALLLPLALILALATPLWMRTHFAHRVRHRKQVPRETLLGFERRLLEVVLITPYLALTAYLINLPALYLGGTMLAALYGIYYTYPSNRRIALDRRIFRVQP